MFCFPAGILQPPSFDASADDAVNDGNLGATIGHEMTHGFEPWPGLHINGKATAFQGGTRARAGQMGFSGRAPACPA